jgi:hypothetical protein
VTGPPPSRFAVVAAETETAKPRARGRIHLREIARVLLVKGKLDGEAEFAGVGFTGQQYKLFRSKRPALGQLLG